MNTLELTAETLAGWLRISEVARRLQVSVQTVRNYTTQGRLRCVKSVGNERLYHPTWVETFLKNRDAEREAVAAIRARYRGEFDIDASMAL